MGRFVVVVLDGFGVGEMPDVTQVRPQDRGTNTCRHIFESVEGLRLPALEKLGLGNILGLPELILPSPDAVFGKAMLLHDGADTFYGHQEIMGTRPRTPFAEPFSNRIGEAERVLRGGGFGVRKRESEGLGFLIVEESATVADNIECDPGQAVNVTAAIDHIPFERVLEIGRLVRGVTQVPRVIAFGGRGVSLSNLLAAVETHGEYVGVNAPRSGVYNEDYHCVHMGYGVDSGVQVPGILGRAGIPVFLLGKAADVVSNERGISLSVVDTAQVLAETLRLIRENREGFFCANVQETDLCGHRGEAREYARKLEAADAGIAQITEALAPDDILIVMADHGNDPSIGHPHHTREMVPLMIRGGAVKGPLDIGIRKTLSDVGATAADYFGARHPENGESFLGFLVF